ncbi:MAG: HD domain-containing protein [Lachnospiraceae bacterium]|nr:HD domain-containing protein [Lachnospiraceae bacterium]
MDFSEKILKEYTEDADKRLALSCRLFILFMLLVSLLNHIGIFKINPIPLNITVLISCFNFFLPTLFYNILKIHNEWMRYVFLTIIVFQSGLQYAVLSYHTIIMLVFPLIIACLYNKKKYVYFAAALSVPMIIISHLVSTMLRVVPDEPLVEVSDVVFFGILPRTIEFFGITVVCIFISDRIENLVKTLASKNSELYADQENLILALSQIIENKSENTGHHVKRVAEYTQLLCKSLGYSEEDSWKISLAAMMHDVGKIMVPETILEKPGKLTKEEFEIVKKHTKYGKQMLESSPGELFRISTEIAHQHHEKWDGTGYMGIAGEDIEPYARCVALADVFDALVSRRSYKRAWTPQEAYDEIVSQRGKQFAPEVVDAFIENFDNFIKVMKKYPDQGEKTA